MSTITTRAVRYDEAFDLTLNPLPQPVVFNPTYTPFVNPVYAGTVVTFNEAAVGLGTLHYQWATDGGAGELPVAVTNIPSGTSQTLVLDTTGWTPGTYNFDVVVTNASGPSTSSIVTLTINAGSAPQPVQQPPGWQKSMLGSP